MACIGLFLVFTIIGFATGLLESDPSNRVAGNALRIAFFVAVIWTWRAVTKRDEATLEDSIAGLNEQAAHEQKKIHSRQSSDEWELHQLEQRVSELKASILCTAGSEQRLLDFQPSLNGKLQCPRCWIADGARCDLTQDGSEHFDKVKCSARGCNFVLNAP